MFVLSVSAPPRLEFGENVCLGGTKSCGGELDSSSSSKPKEHEEATMVSLEGDDNKLVSL
jgi:hypothetical protein